MHFKLACYTTYAAVQCRKVEGLSTWQAPEPHGRSVIGMYGCSAVADVGGGLGASGEGYGTAMAGGGLLVAGGGAGGGWRGGGGLVSGGAGGAGGAGGTGGSALRTTAGGFGGPGGSCRQASRQAGGV
jgi:hypothetical protein